MLKKWRQSAVARKSAALARRVPWAVVRLRASAQDLRDRPPILCNGFPKSGTHLLAQVLAAFPEITDYGRFLASMPSVSFRERSSRTTLRIIAGMAPGEMVRGHLFHAPEYVEGLRQRNAAHFFIYRDPRDVVVSEAHYLASMSRWHRLHRFYKALPSAEERISFAITGAADASFPYDYPDVARRFARYQAWLREAAACCVRFEDLAGERQRETARAMVAFYAERAAGGWKPEDVVERAIANISPERSHTYRKGTVGGWTEVFTAEHREQMKRVAGHLLIELGYERDLDW